MSDQPNTAPMPTSADISTRNATEPINDRTGTIRLTSSRSTHHRQMNQLAASGSGVAVEGHSDADTGRMRSKHDLRRAVAERILDQLVLDDLCIGVCEI